MNTEQITLKTYSKIAANYTAHRRKYKFWTEEYQTFKKFLKGKKILDVGSGSGREAEFFLRDKFDYLGTDASPAMIKQAKKLVPKGKFRLMNMLSLKFPKKSFDGFWAAASLLHIPKKKQSTVLKSLHKILKDDGVGFISLKFGTGEGLFTDKTGYKRFFSYHSLPSFKKILKQNSFNVIKSGTKKHPERKERWLMFFVKKA